MDPQTFTPTEIEKLQRLIDPDLADDPIRDDQIKDSDILFFSQYGHLEATADDPNFQMFQGIDDSASEHFHVNPEEISQALHNATSIEFPENSPQDNTITIKKEPLLNFAQAKYKETDGKSTRVFECEICGKEFGHQYTLMRHIPTHTDERKFHCLTCGKSFRQMSTLSQHRAIHSTERPYVCEVCNKNFNRVSTLISHRKIHTGVKPHRCHMCNKAFHQKGNLRNHIFTHTNERPYRCDICEKGFNQMSNLMCHKLKAHQHQTDIVPKFKCKTCGEEFLKRINLKQHEQFMHGLSSPGNFQSFKDYSNAIIVDPIKTDAMKVAMISGDTPFALLRPLSGIPVLVRVIPAGDKQMLVPATAEDLKKYGQISIRPKVADVVKPPEGDNNKENQSAAAPKKTKGCVVQIKVPVVATVIQKSGGLNGSVSMNVLSPGPGDILDERGGNMADLNVDSFVYTSSLTDDVLGSSGGVNDCHKATGTNSMDAFVFDDKYDHLIGSVVDSEVEFVDQTGNIVCDGSSFSKSLEVNPMEYTFDIPQDARDYPNDQNADDDLIILNDCSVVGQKNDTPDLVHVDIPDKILIEKNGEYVEL